MPTLTGESFLDKMANDAAYRARFIADAKPVLAQMGLTYPESTKVHILETDAHDIAIVIGSEEMYSEQRLQEMGPQMRRVIVRTFRDPAFKALLLANPAEAMLREVGYRVPKGTKMTAYESTDRDVYLTIDRDPASEELSDLELEVVAGGGGGYSMINPQPLPPAPMHLK